MNRIRFWLCAVAAMLATMLSLAGNRALALAPAATLTTGQVHLAPHRAVYDMVLERSKSNNGVRALTGRMVFEFMGSPCEGYTQNMRFVTRLTGRHGRETVTDLRTSSWEDGEGRRFRFNSSHYRNARISAVTAGDARRAATGGRVTVTLSKPKARRLDLPARVLFPVQHSIRLLQAALSGARVFQADLYDGSEKGEKVYATTAIIGDRLAPGANRELARIPNAERLDGVASWPISIAYYPEGTFSGEQMPSYELALRIYANGVTRKLLIDYGTFSIRGTLRQIEFFEPTDCGPARDKTGKR